MEFLCRNIECKLERLVSQLIYGKVVPFIGAGVSNAASASNGDEEKGVLCIKDMQENIINQLIQWKKNENTNGNTKAKLYVEWFCRDRGCKGEVLHNAVCGDRKKCKLYDNASFSHLCEVYSWIYECNRGKGVSHIVDFLGIKKYTRNDPTCAHRYIAFLAREGIIQEVITTNYDTLLEKAYCESFGINYDEYINGNKTMPFKVITNLEDYRKNMSPFLYNNQYYPQLKIYKLNGCAQEYERNGDTEEAKEKILLTEKQLQDWRERQWARDLLRDRLRSCSLLFSGFGSDEPQIRHTALQIAEEYSGYVRMNSNNYNNNNQKGINSSYTDSLFIAAYEKDLTFNQIQIMYEYLKAYSGNDSGNAEINLYRIYCNAFTGNDYQFFNANRSAENKEVLEADLFWMRVYQIVFWRLMRKFCSENSPIYNFLCGVMTGGANTLLNEMLNYFLPEGKYFSILSELLDLSCDQDKVLPLMRWVYYIRNDQKNLTRGWYVSLSEKPVLIPLILLFIYAAVKTESPERPVSWNKLNEMIIAQDGIFGLRLKLQDEVIVLLRHGSCAFHNGDTVELPDFVKTKTTIIQFLIPDKTDIKPKKIRVKCKLNSCLEDMPKIKEIYVYQMSIGEMFKCRGEITALQKRFKEILSNAGMIPSQSRKRLKDRARLL